MKPTRVYDPYANPPFTGSRADDPRVEKYDVMLSDPNQKVYGYNIAMMLHAFKNNQLQNYGNDTSMMCQLNLYNNTG